MDRIDRSDIASESERVVVISRSLRLLPFRLADIPGERTANLQERGDLRVNIRIQGISVKLRSDDITTFRQITGGKILIRLIITSAHAHAYIRTAARALDSVFPIGIIRPHERSVRVKHTVRIHDLIVHDYGPGRRFASVHVELDAREDVLEAHELIDSIERDVTKKLRVELVVHYDPVVTDDAELSAVRQRVEGVINAIDPRLSFHDLRMVRGREHTNVIFDLVLPFDLRGEEDAIRRRISEALRAEGHHYRTIITFDSEAFNDIHTRMEADVTEPPVPEEPSGARRE